MQSVAAGVWCLLLLGPFAAHAQRVLSVLNNCPETIWLASAPNSGVEPLAANIQLAPGARYAYQIPSSGWAGRFWPKVGCDAGGGNCAIGQSSPPCPASGCQPPADTKVEFLWPAAAAANQAAWYDISLVDGYSLSVQVSPVGIKPSGSCVVTTCNLSPASTCPSEETQGIGDLRVVSKGRTVACLSPCKKWNYPAPWGLGRAEQVPPGVLMCCPTPPVTPQQCSAGPVVTTKYVQTVRAACPTAYSYAYDDKAGLHSCPGSASFAVTLCPGGGASAASKTLRRSRTSGALVLPTGTPAPSNSMQWPRQG